MTSERQASRNEKDTSKNSIVVREEEVECTDLKSEIKTEVQKLLDDFEIRINSTIENAVNKINIKIENELKKITSNVQQQQSPDNNEILAYLDSSTASLIRKLDDNLSGMIAQVHKLMAVQRNAERTHFRASSPSQLQTQVHVAEKLEALKTVDELKTFETSITNDEFQEKYVRHIQLSLSS